MRRHRYGAALAARTAAAMPTATSVVSGPAAGRRRTGHVSTMQARIMVVPMSGCAITSTAMATKASRTGIML